jgi:hypothetical protein
MKTNQYCNLGGSVLTLRNSDGGTSCCGETSKMAGNTKAKRSIKTKTAASTVERLEYVADLLMELQGIATEAGCETLAGLISLSHAEALRRVQNPRH